MENILSLAKKNTEQAEVFQVISKRTPIHFEADRIKQIQTKESTSTALRIIKDGKIGFAQASGYIADEDLVNMAVETSQFGMPSKFDFPGSQTYPEIETLDPQTEQVTIEQMIDTVEQLISTIKQHTPGILCEASISKGSVTVNIANSRGGEASYNKSVFSLSIGGVLVQNGDMLFVGDGMSSCHPVLDFKIIAEEVMRQLNLAKQNATISTRTMPVIFTPDGVASALIAPLLSAFNGKVVLDGASPLKDKLGIQTFDKRISLWDDATIPYRVGSAPCDDEGVPTQRTTLIDHGVVSHFLYDLQTAALANTKSTGNGSRNGGLPTPSTNSIVISSGDATFTDMVKDIKQGLIIDQLIGAEQGNILNGDFSGNVLLGYKIEAGEIIGRVKDTMVSGNVYQILKRLEAIGQDAKWVGGTLQIPHIYCPSISVATKTG